MNPSTTGQQSQLFKTFKGHRHSPKNQPAADIQKHIASTHKKRQVSHVRRYVLPTGRLSSERQPAPGTVKTWGTWTFLSCCGASSDAALGKTARPSFKRFDRLTMPPRKSTPKYPSAAITRYKHTKSHTPLHTGQHSLWPHSETTQRPSDAHVIRVYTCRVQREERH